MKRILIFSLAYPRIENFGGAEVAIKEITDRIPNVEFHMVTNRFDSLLPKVEKVGNITVHRIGIVLRNPSMSDLKQFPLDLNKPLFQFLAFFKAIPLQHHYSFDGVWAMMAHSTGVPSALFKMLYPRIPYVLTLQEGDPLPYIEKRMMLVWPLFVRAFRTANVIQSISTYLDTWARSLGARGKLIIVPNATDTKLFFQRPSPGELQAALDSMRMQRSAVVMISTSRLVHKNALDDVIRALPLLDTQIHFVNLGFGPDKEQLEKLATSLGVGSRVHLLPHPGISKLSAYLHASSLFVRPSRTEGFGVSFVEAMAAGLPVIATQEGGIADFLFDAKRNPNKPTTGWAVDKDSPEQIVAAVRDILAHPEQVQRVTETAKSLVLSKYDWDLIAKDMQTKVFDVVLKK